MIATFSQCSPVPTNVFRQKSSITNVGLHALFVVMGGMVGPCFEKLSPSVRHEKAFRSNMQCETPCDNPQESKHFKPTHHTYNADVAVHTTLPGHASGDRKCSKHERVTTHYGATISPSHPSLNSVHHRLTSAASSEGDGKTQMQSIPASDCCVHEFIYRLHQRNCSSIS